MKYFAESDKFDKNSNRIGASKVVCGMFVIFDKYMFIAHMI